MIVFFGKHEIIEQWKEVTKGDGRFAYCESYQELEAYSPQNTYVVFVRIPNIASLRITMKLKLKGYKIAKFWAGTDSRYFNDAKGLEKFFSKIIYRLFINKNLSPAPWLSDVLENNGLKTDYWQSCSPIFLKEEQLTLDKIPIPLKKTISKVLVYSNPDRHWIYNTKMMLELAKEHPEIKFVFVGDSTMEVDDLNNVESLGRINQEQLFLLFNECDILLRITSHDGYSRMAIEAMYFGMHVITNWPVPHAIVCKNKNEITQALKLEVDFNRAGYDYIRKEFNVESWKNTLIKALLPT